MTCRRVGVDEGSDEAYLTRLVQEAMDRQMANKRLSVTWLEKWLAAIIILLLITSVTLVIVVWLTLGQVQRNHCVSAQNQALLQRINGEVVRVPTCLASA